MPLIRFHHDLRNDWSVRRLSQPPHLMTGGRATSGGPGKFEERGAPLPFPKNDGSILRKAICSGRNEVSAVGYGGAAAATAKAMPQFKPKVSEYIGRIVEVIDNQVIAEIGPPDDMDCWDVVLDARYFPEVPKAGQTFRCKIARTPTPTGVNVSVNVVEVNLPRKGLQDFGIDREEWLHWASQIDVWSS